VLGKFKYHFLKGKTAMANQTLSDQTSLAQQFGENRIDATNQAFDRFDVVVGVLAKAGNVAALEKIGLAFDTDMGVLSDNLLDNQTALPNYKTVNLQNFKFAQAQRLLPAELEIVGLNPEISRVIAGDIAVMTAAFVELKANADLIEDSFEASKAKKFGEAGNTMTDMLANPEDLKPNSSTVIINPIEDLKQNFNNAFKPAPGLTMD
jgi:hypothetical protein